MDTEKQRNVGLLQIVTGLGVVVLAVLLFGVTKDDGTADWISIITAIAGAVLAFTGMYAVFRSRGTRPAGLKR
jgi:hypothetical protein